MGLLMHRPVVAQVPHMHFVDYCMYRDERFDRKYRKRTCIWTNTDWVPSKPLCDRSENNCGCIDEFGRHPEQAQIRGTDGQTRRRTRELYVMPPLLLEDIEAYCSLISFDRFPSG